VNAPAPRRFICRACRRVHLAWAPRCPSCLNHEALALVTGESPLERLAVPPAPVAVPAPSVPDLPAPRLVVVRAPEPALEDPIEELVDAPASPASDDDPILLSEISETTFVRDSTGLPPLDHVLGGGLVVASVVLLASPPGIGKSSLTLQMLVGLKHRCLYVTGEETREQLAATARRIGAVSSRLYVLAERNLTKILAHAHSMRAQTIAIDSIQKMICDDVGGRAGSPGQLKECTARLVDYAKSNDTAVWLIGHVTGDGDIAGPKTIEHDVDVVLELSATEVDDPWTKLKRLASEQPDLSIAEALQIADRLPVEVGSGSERILRCPSKNRFGATNVVGRFELTGKGFVAVDADGWNEGL
jgi:predicted ATP-dependent serine protease